MQHDAIVIGGSFAGLSATTYLARARRSVVVVDTGVPRNRPAAQSHGFLTQDGASPADMLATARAQVARYPTVTFTQGEALFAGGATDAFWVELANGERLEARRLVLAFGVRDQLPSLPGLAERWGTSVLHCPYCHGFELSGRQLGVLYMTPASVQQAMLIAEWGPTTLLLNGVPQLEGEQLAALRRRGITIEHEEIVGLHGPENELNSVELAGGRRVDMEAIYIGTKPKLGSDLARQLGCAIEDLNGAEVIPTNEARMSSVDGVYAAGDIVRGAHSVTFASADGVLAGIALHRSLVF